MDSHASTAVVLVDTAGSIRYWSEGARALFGHVGVEGQTLDVIVPDEYREQHWAGFHRAMATGEAAASGGRLNIPVRCSDGEVRSFPGTFSILCDGHGRTVGAIGMWSARRGDEEPFTPIEPAT